MHDGEPLGPDRLTTLLTTIAILLICLVILGMIGVVQAEGSWREVTPPPGPDFCGIGTVCSMEFRGTRIAVFQDGVLSHCKIDFCLDTGPYTEDGYLTFGDMMRITGCDVGDVVEAYAVAGRFKTMGNDRMSVEIGDRA